jgi:hypothetical protein
LCFQPPALERQIESTQKRIACTADSADYRAGLDVFARTQYNFSTSDFLSSYVQTDIHAVAAQMLESIFRQRCVVEFWNDARSALYKDSKDQLTFDSKVSDGWCVLIPAGSWHNVTNIGDEPMQLYAIYAPAHHRPGKVHRTADEAAADPDDQPAKWSVQPPATHPDEHA